VASGQCHAGFPASARSRTDSARKPGSVGRGTDVRVSIMNAQGQHCRPCDRGEVVIHQGTSISDYANVYSHDHDLNDGMIINNTKTEIGPRARVTYHATVMSGVTVGEHGMVGSMGVATKDVPPYHIVAGIPAKPIKVKTIAPDSVKAAAEKK